ncbi:MAG: hypothetical protein HKP37_06490 [Boseongicola sp.]|nr:hypothetical protein [Boseongicola sp.]NNL18372.1 hypothetical protein [Boseongicola sp.]
MLGTLILGIAAGALAPYAEPKVKTAVENILLDDVPATPIEMRLFSFAICLVGAAILSMAFGEPHAAPLAIGAALGIFGPRLQAKWKASRNPDYDS